jgi:hypothetical protein
MDIDYNLNDIKKISYDTIFRHLKQYEVIKISSFKQLKLICKQNLFILFQVCKKYRSNQEFVQAYR